jgi:hypothetical protein
MAKICNFRAREIPRTTEVGLTTHKNNYRVKNKIQRKHTNIVSDTFSSRAKQHRRTYAGDKSKGKTLGKKMAFDKGKYEPKTPVNESYKTKAFNQHLRQGSTKKFSLQPKQPETRVRDRSTVASKFSSVRVVNFQTF